VVGRARWLWATLVASLTLYVLGAVALAAVIGPAPVAMLAQPMAFALVAGLVIVAFSQLPRFGLRPHRREPWRIGEPSWPAWCAGWSVGCAPAIGAVHGRDGPGLRAPRL
jgi:hypothetical protein